MQIPQPIEPRKTKAQRHRERRRRAQSLYTLRQVVDHIRETVTEAEQQIRNNGDRAVDRTWNWHEPRKEATRG
jgi:phytoene/squalene synthetase